MNEELQRGIIGDFLLDGRDLCLLRELVRKRGLEPKHFTDPVLRTAYETLLATSTADRVILAQELARKVGLSTVEECMARASLTIDEAGVRIRRLADAGILAEARETVESKMRELDGKASADFVISDICRELAALSARRGADSADVGYSLADLADPVPEEENPNALICGGWLRKGQAAVLAAATGVGKSVVTIQFASAWALGREMLGLRPIRPLRIGIFQTEDDAEDLAWFRTSMRKGFATFCGWTPDEIAAAERNVRFHSTAYKTGESFVNLLADVQRRNRYDLVIVNPLQGVCGCNLSDNNEMRALLTEKIDPVIKSPDTACGLLIVHHTNKPTIHNGQQGFGGDQYAEYLGAGASVLSNWMRAMLVIMKTKEDDTFHLIAAKRGKRLNWPKREDLKCSKPTRVIRHAPNEMQIAFWLEDTAVRPREDGASSGPDPKTDAERLARDFRKLPRTLTEARTYATEIFGKSRHRNESAYETLVKDPDAYGLVIIPSGIGRQSLIGTAEGVENAISSLREKQAQKLLAKVAKK